MKHLNIFIIYDGVYSSDSIFKRLDEISPLISSKGDHDTENYLIHSDLPLPDETLDKLCFAMLTMPYKEKKKRTDFKCTLSFYNLRTKAAYVEIKKSLEDRGFTFSSLSANAELIKRALEWYYPVIQD